MIVVDSAAVVDALTVASGSQDLRAELTAEELHAPTLLDFEIVSALRGLTLSGQLSAARAQDALTDFDDLAIQRWPSGAALQLGAFSLRDNLTAYDAPTWPSPKHCGVHLSPETRDWPAPAGTT